MYDAIVVGARVAGAPTAMLLAQKGYRVLLVDRASFPSETPKGHFIQPAGVAFLHRWGLLERVAADAPAVRHTTFDLGPFALEGSPRWPTGQIAEAYAPRRSGMDDALATAAVAAGAELRERFSVDGLVFDGDRVTGVRGRASGRSVVESARVVIGADGTYSRVARAVDAPIYHVRPTLSGGYWSYWSGVRTEGLEVYPRDGRLALAFPTSDGLTCVAAQWQHAAFHTVRADIERHYLAALEIAPSLRERVAGGYRQTPFEGRFDLHNYFRRPFGAGWALVGDAGYLKDPITGQGIGDAFRDAELLTEALDAGFTGRQPLDAALADYERRRNEHALPMYEFTLQLAALESPPPEMQALFAALRGNQAEIDRFLGAFAGTVPVQEFFAPENVRRIVSRRSLDPAKAA